MNTNVVYADAIEQISWPDLRPQLTDFNDPFKSLSEIQLYELSRVAKYEEQLANGVQLSQDASIEYTATRASLIEQKIDINWLLAMRKEITQKRRAVAESLNTTLDNQNVRIAGYLLPLNFTNDLVDEFLLVPTVGACIHVPPPPPNQMIYVKFPKGFKSSELYSPVWVEGRLAVGKGKSHLYLSDGADDIMYGYSLNASEVEDYKH
ncbi:DUF3299 domain-containing protein [Vibrio parahaemolyticus]|uniref:DUF3299 domain-containing protein n=1 Tax=Vibrio parahaemolyticus TaxID=670 RepID=UPI0015DEB9F9|nr:DUF3299 domain-containing protein [Vibrio parahaemolyticus]